MLKILEILVSNVGPEPVMHTQVSRAFPQPSSKLPKFYSRLGLDPPTIYFSDSVQHSPLYTSSYSKYY